MIKTIIKGLQDSDWSDKRIEEIIKEVKSYMLSEGYKKISGCSLDIDELSINLDSKFKLHYQHDLDY